MKRPPLVLATLGAVAFLLAGIAVHLPALDLARLSIFGAALGGAVAVDLAERRIPNRLVVPAGGACAALLVAGGVRFEDLLAGLGVVGLLLVFSASRSESFGMGDVKLALIIVFGLNGDAAQSLLLGLALAALLGVLLLVRYGRAVGRRSLPLAPFLAAGSLLAFLT